MRRLNFILAWLRLITAWLRVYDPRKPLEPQYPSIKPSTADFVAELGDESVTTASAISNRLDRDLDIEELKFAPPGYANPLQAKRAVVEISLDPPTQVSIITFLLHFKR